MDDTSRGALGAREIMEVATGFQRSRPVLAAAELDLFTHLGDRKLTAAEVAQEIGADERALSPLLDVLAAQGFLRKESGRYENTPEGRTLLVKNAPGSILAVLLHMANMWQRWGTLESVVRTGQTAEYLAVNDRGPDFLEAFIGAMDALAQDSAPMVARAVGLAGVHRMLDVGGGAASYAIAFAREEPGLSAVVFDLPNVVPIAQRNVERAGLQDRITTQVGDYLTDPLGEGYDLALLSAIVHSNSLDENADLVRKCHDALVPKGRLVIRDFIMSPDRTEPAAGALFAINMLVGTQGGGTYTEAEMRGWMEGVGFVDVKRVDLPGMNALMIGTRKG